jgi:Fe-Mn family superoxide dismutase
MFELMQLPYDYSALEPHIDRETVETHYDKHHRGYVAKLNAALEGTDLINKNLEEILQNMNLVPEEKYLAVFNNGGQVYNHNLYWMSISPNGGGEPSGQLAEKINQTFGSFEKFKQEFNDLGTTQFGSGWVWLSVDSNKELVLESTSNADSPIFHKMTPIMTMDVWEHAYYLKYKNLRPDYIQSFWNIVDWKAISKKFEDAVA